MNLTFLNASVPLTKSYTKLLDGTIEKSSYPNVWEVTSIAEDVSSLKEFEIAITRHAALGNCLLKGNVLRPLISESRKGSTDRNATTEFLCLDIDGISPNYTTITTRFDPITGDTQDVPVTINVTVEYILEQLGLKDISYIVQWSGSMGIGNNTLRCHIFIMLAKAVSAPLIKQWLIQKNHEVPLLRDHQALTKTGNSLTWGLDITACQADKLIYIAPPTLKGIKNPLGRTPRISLITKSHPTFDLTGKVNSTDQNRALSDARVLELRDRDGLPKRKLAYKHIGGHEVLVKPGECIATEMKTDRGFVYFNLNGGDSWAYFHPEDSPDYIHNFKGEPVYLTKELLPAYWETLSHQAYRTSSTGVTYLAFLERTTSTYYRGTYIEDTETLDIYPAKTESMVRQFADSNGLRIGANIPEWDMEFDPLNSATVDFDNKIINTFMRTKYMKAPTKKVTKCPPMCLKIISHILADDKASINHLLNWLACIAQNLDRTRTAWVFQGIPGCLAGDTELLFCRGKRPGGRINTIKEAYELWSGKYSRNGKGWDPKLVTRTKSVVKNGAIGYHEVYNIMEAGVKRIYKLTTNSGRSIRVSELHPFMRPDGSFTPLNELVPGDIIMGEGKLRGVEPKQIDRQARHITYSIPHHPYAWKHITNGKNYQRSPTARLVVEANMNNMSLEDFVDALRNDALKSAQFKYLGFDAVVHHLDEDTTNDKLDNLTVIDEKNHDSHHGNSTTIGMFSTVEETVMSIEEQGDEMTYDITMKAPYQNYVANGLVVHNTGKGLLFNKILKPIFGEKQTVIKRASELTEKWTDFAEGKFIVFIDEIQTSALKDEAGYVANMKNLITEPTISVRAMFKNASPVRNYTNWLFASNKPDPVTVDKNDRRFNVGPYQGTEFPRPTDEEIDAIETELQTFYHFLLSYNVDKLQASTPLQSEARSTLQELSETTADTAANAIRNGDIEYFLNQLPDSKAYNPDTRQQARIDLYRRALFDILIRTGPRGYCVIKRDELFSLFNWVVGNMSNSPATFTRYLGHKQLTIKPLNVPGEKTQRGIAVSWVNINPTALLKEHFSDMIKPTKLKVVA
jgi:hypothetical protein